MVFGLSILDIKASDNMNDTYIEKLHAVGFRQFETLDVEFNKGFNFISGPNGCGKTSVLTAISHCFSTSSFKYSRFTDEAEYWSDLSVCNKKYRVGLGKGSLLNGEYRNTRPVRYNTPPLHGDGRESMAINNVSELKYCPLFIGAERSIKYTRINGLSREEDLDTQIDKYSRTTAQSIYGDQDRNIKQWLVNRYFVIDKEWAGEEKENWNHMIDTLPFLAPFDSGFSYIETGRDLEPIFSIYDKRCYIEELSAGFQAVLSIIACIIEWVEGTGKEGARLAKEATGTVLIDELDLHLHPEWQFTLRDGLVRLFPKLQFIVTTHSPHLLSSAQEGEVIIMNRLGAGSLKPVSKSFSGWNTDQILSEVMGVVSLDNKVYKKLIDKSFDCLEKFDLESYKLAVSALEEIAHPSDPILKVLRARYAAKLMSYND